MSRRSDNSEDRRLIGSLKLLRAANDDLLIRLRDMESATDKRDLILDFIGRAVASGALFEGPTERRTIQGIIDYWAASYPLHRPAICAGKREAAAPMRRSGTTIPNSSTNAFEKPRRPSRH